MERAAFLTGSALDAFADIDGVRLFQFSGNGGDRAEPCTFGTALTQLGIDLQVNKRLALSGRAFFIHNMGDIFVPEIFHGADNREIGRASCRERVCLYV